MSTDAQQTGDGAAVAQATDTLSVTDNRTNIAVVATWNDLGEGTGDWIASDHERARTAEDSLATELGLAPGELLLDFPAKPQMLGLDLPVLRNDGHIRRLTTEGWPGAINLPVLSEQLYRSARVLRVFVAHPVELESERVMRLVSGESG